MEIKAAKPFVKWVGGKTQLLEEIRKYYPTSCNKYCEPFVGGGAVLFDILQTFHPECVLINDINKELINLYTIIRDNCEPLIESLKKEKNLYQETEKEKRKELFLEKRSRYNELIVIDSPENKLEEASLFIFLNKTCFNGLYRVNAKGLFNVPFNNAMNPLICDEENIRACSKLLQNVLITAGDYSYCDSFIDRNTFVYIDPPYRPLTKTSAFTSYSADRFNDEQQIELGEFIKKQDRKGAKILTSNSDPCNIDKNDLFFDNIFVNFRVMRVRAQRMINSNGEKRGSINELLISNWN